MDNAAANRRAIELLEQTLEKMTPTQESLDARYVRTKLSIIGDQLTHLVKTLAPPIPIKRESRGVQRLAEENIHLRNRIRILERERARLRARKKESSRG